MLLAVVTPLAVEEVTEAYVQGSLDAVLAVLSALTDAEGDCKVMAQETNSFGKALQSVAQRIALGWLS